MPVWAQIGVGVLTALLASSGFWSYVMMKSTKNTAEQDMLRGLGHDRIMEKGLMYIERGYITKDEYENLYEYLYKPYERLNGNGSAKRIMEEVNRLPIR